MNRQRGFGMLGLTAMIAVVVALCAAVSVSSMRSARGSIRGIQRLQVQAAAEGAAVLLATGDVATSGTVEVGNCVVRISPDQAYAGDAATSASRSKLTATLRLNDRDIYSRKYAATTAGPVAPIKLEALPE